MGNLLKGVFYRLREIEAVGQRMFHVIKKTEFEMTSEKTA